MADLRPLLRPPPGTDGGGLDAQTPTFRSEIVARALPGARLVVFPDSAHVQLGAINFCAAKIVVAFVGDPSAKRPLECVDDLRFPGFILPDGSASVVGSAPFQP